MTDFAKECSSRRRNRALGEKVENELRKLLERDERKLMEIQEYETGLASEVQKSTSGCSSSLARLENAKHRHELAVELHETLLSSMDALKLSDSALSKAHIYSMGDSNVVQHLADIALALQEREQATIKLSKDVTAASGSVARAHEGILIAEEDYESALAILWHQREEHRQALKHIKDLEESIFRKKIPLQSCFRVPPHLWEAIFDYIVSADGEPFQYVSPNEIIKGWKHGSRCLMLSTVCHAWRLLIHSSPSLWRYIYIPLTSDFERSWRRINLYLKKYITVPPVVTVYSPRSKRFQITRLQNLVAWNHATGLARLICEVRENTTYEYLGAFLKKLPSPEILLLWDGTQPPCDTAPLLDVPSTLLQRTKRLGVVDVCTDVAIQLHSTHPLPLEAYVHTAMVHRRCTLPQWLRGSSIRFLRIDGVFSTEEQHIPCDFTTVQELEIPLKTLSGYLIAGYSFPSLLKLILIHTEDCVEEDWQCIRGRPFPDLHTIGLESIEEENTTKFSSVVCDMQRGCSLELRAESVDTVTTAFDEANIPPCMNVRFLKVSQYHGRGGSILSYVRKCAEREGSQMQEVECGRPRPRMQTLRKILFEDCPNVTPDTRLEISALLNSIWDD